MNISPKFRLSTLCAILLAVTTEVQGADLTTNDIVKSVPIAKESLKEFQASITASNYALMGLDSPSQRSLLKLGDPFKMYILSLAHLTNYSTNQAFSGLLDPAQKLIYPFEVTTGAVASSILRLENGKWKISSLGQPRLIRNLDRIRKSLVQDAQRSGTPIPKVFAAQVPIVSMWMAGYFDPGSNAVLYAYVHILSPGSTNSDHQVSVTEMERLATEAKAYTGLSN